MCSLIEIEEKRWVNDRKTSNKMISVPLFQNTFSESSAASNEKREIFGRIIFPKIKVLRVVYYSNCRNILSLRFISPTMPLLRSIAISGFNEQHRSGMAFTQEDQVIGNEHFTRSLRLFNKLFFVNLFHYLVN